MLFLCWVFVHMKEYKETLYLVGFAGYSEWIKPGSVFIGCFSCELKISTCNLSAVLLLYNPNLWVSGFSEMEW